MRVAVAAVFCICPFLDAITFSLHAAEETECLREARALPSAIKAIDYSFSTTGLDGRIRMVWERGRWYRRHSPSNQGPIAEYSFDGKRYERKDLSGMYMSSAHFSWLRFPELDVHPLIRPYSWFTESPRDLSLSVLADQERWSEVIRRFEFLGVKTRGTRRCEVYRLVETRLTYTIWFSIEDHGYPVYITVKQNERDGQGSFEAKQLVTLPGPVVIGTQIVSKASHMPSDIAQTVHRSGFRVNHQPDWNTFSFRPAVDPSLELGHRLANALRDAGLNSSRCVVLIEEQSVLSVGAEKPHQAYFTSAALSKIKREYPSFIAVSITPESIELNQEDGLAILASRNWPVPIADSTCLIVLDANGLELGRLECSRTEAEGLGNHVRDFLNQQKKKQRDAKKMWDSAFSLAKATNRRVWVRTGNNQCVPCILMTRWIDGNRNVLEREFVSLKVDTGDLNGPEVLRLLGRQNVGFPFHAIFDADGEKLVDSINLTGVNIGFPRGDENALLHLRKMIETTELNLTLGEINQLVDDVNGGLENAVKKSLVEAEPTSDK